MERKAGGDDGCGAAVQVLDTLKEDGAVFDTVLDTVGGKEVREEIKKKCVDRYEGAANMTNLEDPQWTSVATAHDSGRLNLNLASIATSTPSASLITITMKFFTIFVASWFIVLTVWFLDPRKPVYPPRFVPRTNVILLEGASPKDNGFLDCVSQNDDEEFASEN